MKRKQISTEGADAAKQKAESALDDATCSDSLFYEVVLSNCDGLDCILHVWNDGTVERVSGTAYAQRKLVPLFHDPEAPEFVLVEMRRMGWRDDKPALSFLPNDKDRHEVKQSQPTKENQ